MHLHTNRRGPFVAPLRQNIPRLDLTVSSNSKGNENDDNNGFTIMTQDVRPTTDLQDVVAFLNNNYREKTSDPFDLLFSDSLSVPDFVDAVSAVVLARERGAIVGTLGLTVTGLNRRTKQARRLDNETSAKIPLFDKDSVAVYQGMVNDKEAVSPKIWNLVVRKNERRRGLARKLLSFAEEQLKASGYPEVHLLVKEENRPASRLYNSSGYRVEWSEIGEVVRTQLWMATIEKVDVLCMSKNLTSIGEKAIA